MAYKHPTFRPGQPKIARMAYKQPADRPGKLKTARFNSRYNIDTNR